MLSLCRDKLRVEIMVNMRMTRPEFKKPEFLDKPTKEIFLGDYDYKFLCMPKLNPWSKQKRQPQPKYGKDDFLGLLLAFVTGLQHFMACVGGYVSTVNIRKY